MSYVKMIEKSTGIVLIYRGQRDFCRASTDLNQGVKRPVERIDIFFPEVSLSAYREDAGFKERTMTLKDVASKANVSTATVSRVLNNTGFVKEATRKRVIQAANELRYHPNLHARSLAGARSRTIGMIVSNIENPFFLEIFCGLESIAYRRGYEVVVENTDYRANRLVEDVRSMLGRHVAGLAVIVSEMDSALIDELTESQVPIVFYDVGHPTLNITNIRVRYEKGVQKVVEYLYSLGHRRMGFIGHHAGLGPIQAREKTFLGTMEKYAGDVEYKTAVSSDSPAGGQSATHELLSGEFKPTAIVCVNDFMAIGALRELSDEGYDVPGDVSVTGFDNIDLSRYTCPSLTTLDIPRDKIGQMVFEALIPKHPSLQRSHEIIIEPELLVRGSTGPVRRD